MSCDAHDYDDGPTRAELDGLLAVIVATVDLAERARSEAASVLLRRAMAIVQSRGTDPAGRDAAAAQDFRPS